MEREVVLVAEERAVRWRRRDRERRAVGVEIIEGYCVR